MGAAYLDWAWLTLVFLILGGLAQGFSRRTLRAAMLVTIVAGVVVVTRIGLLHDGRHPGDFAGAFLAGADRLAQVMFSPVMPIGLVAGTAALDPWSGDRTHGPAEPIPGDRTKGEAPGLLTAPAWSPRGPPLRAGPASPRALEI